MPPQSPTVGLFVTCLVNLFRPSVGFASVQLLEAAGCRVVIPEQQSCCGQPGYNPGDYDGARRIAKTVIPQFEDVDYVVIPSGSCAGMLRVHYPELLKDDPQWHHRAQALASKTYELTQFLHDVLGYQPPAQNAPTVTYHDACAGLRELGVQQQPRALLEQSGSPIAELEEAEECCGFGGTFCAKMPNISQRMVDDKLDAALASGATTLLGGDMGCLLNIAGRASRRGAALQVRHVAEALVGDWQTPAIGEEQSQ